MTGDVGQVGIRHFADNPVFDLVGVLVHSEDKVGKDAGEIAGIAPIGVVATDDVESIIAMDADCVFYTPIIMDVDTVCRLLRSGKNVVTTSGFFHPSETSATAANRSAPPARTAGPRSTPAESIRATRATSFPSRLRAWPAEIDKIEVHEVVNVLTDAPLDHIDWLGFGKEKDKFLSEPTILGLGTVFFAQSMYMIADGLGVTIDEVTSDLKAAVATEDIPHELGSIPRAPSPRSTTSGRPGSTAPAHRVPRDLHDVRPGQARPAVGLG